MAGSLHQHQCEGELSLSSFCPLSLGPRINICAANQRPARSKEPSLARSRACWAQPTPLSTYRCRRKKSYCDMPLGFGGWLLMLQQLNVREEGFWLFFFFFNLFLFCFLDQRSRMELLYHLIDVFILT